MYRIYSLVGGITLNKLNVGVIFGGKSTEHEVSRVSALSVIKNIDKQKYNIHLIGITKGGKWLSFEGDIEKIASDEWEKEGVPAFIVPDTEIKGLIRLKNETYETVKLDVVFPILHGLYGEDGTIQGLLELADIPYVGCGVLASAISMNKVYTKIVCKDKGIPQCRFMWVDKNEIHNNIEKVIKDIEKQFGYPCFIKPSNSGSSIGINKAHNKEELIDSLNTASRHDKKVIIEEFVTAREFECSVLGGNNPIASVVGEIVSSSEFYDYQAKYHGDSKLFIPADIDKETSDLIKNLAIDVFKAVDGKGMARVDFFLEKATNKVYVNEINTIPGFTSISMYPKLLEYSGIKYKDLIDRLIKQAIE